MMTAHTPPKHAHLVPGHLGQPVRVHRGAAGHADVGVVGVRLGRRDPAGGRARIVAGDAGGTAAGTATHGGGHGVSERVRGRGRADCDSAGPGRRVGDGGRAHFEGEGARTGIRTAAERWGGGWVLMEFRPSEAWFSGWERRGRNTRCRWANNDSGPVFPTILGNCGGMGVEETKG